MNINLRRLKSDLAYWKECDPTNGQATHFRTDHHRYSWYKFENNKKYFWSAGENLWIESYGSRGNFYPIPSFDNSWRGPKEGLPPIKSFCTIKDNGRLAYGADHVGLPMEVVAHVENCAVLRLEYGLGCFELSVLTPIKTEREKTIEEILSIISLEIGETTRDQEIIETLYDADLIKLPNKDK